jgi:hypothetical protein
MMQAISFRLRPGQDLFDEIQAVVVKEQIEAGCVLSAVGSLAHAAIRFAGQKDISELDGRFEIVSMTGTISVHGSHLHISIADKDGKTIGGHLMPGCKIYTTAEMALGIFKDVVYKREFAEDSGYEELVVYYK